jgi:hypothetical protein
MNGNNVVAIKLTHNGTAYDFHVTRQVRVIRQLLEAHVHHIRAVSDHSTTECGCNMMLENLCHSLSHYHVRKLESQLQVSKEDNTAYHENNILDSLTKIFLIYIPEVNFHYLIKNREIS